VSKVPPDEVFGPDDPIFREGWSVSVPTSALEPTTAPAPEQALPRKRTGDLVAAGTAVETADDLVKAAGPLLVDLLTALVARPEDTDDQDWLASDTRLLIIEFSPGGEASHYIQFRSVPYAWSILCEIASPHYQPSLTQVVTPEGEQQLADLGYGLPERSNYRREIARTPDLPQELAAETLRVMFDVLAYRGDHTLTYRLLARRATIWKRPARWSLLDVVEE
jgi:hypothetical protein